MKKNLLRYILPVLFLILQPVNAQFNYGFKFSKAGSAGLQFLKIGVGARECAMGEAATADYKDVNALFWNVAGLAYVQKKEISFTHSNWLVNSQHYAAVAAIPFNQFVVALSFVTLAIDDFEETTVLMPDGTGQMVSAYDFLIGLAFSRRFTQKLSIGGQIKFVQEKLDTYSANNILFDIGTLYETGFRNLRLAFSFQHFGPDMRITRQKFRTPLIFRIGAADKIFDNEKFCLTTGIDLVHPTDNNEWINAGVEFTFLKAVSLRGGYRYNRDEGRVTLGAGFVLIRSFADFKIDYAFMPFGDIFNEIHRFSVGMAF